jgi:murein DD-endopeptidase MepM/ murein hydrolase activator NlpD
VSGNEYIPKIHPGIDIAAWTGMPVYASDTGVVVYAGWNDSGYGNLVIIDHGNGWQTAYAHNSQINVRCGQTVYQGDVIALAGSTGRSTGPHIHFEMRSDLYGRVNPWLYLPPP